MKKLLIVLLITMPAFLFATSNIGSNYGINTLSDALKNKLNFSKGSKIIISGTFTIDVDYSFIGNDIDMASGSITVTAPNTITSFYDSHIYCSTGMWAGISTYGQITVSECVIEDAISGVYVQVGGEANIRRTNFNNNIIGAECIGNSFIINH